MKKYTWLIVAIILLLLSIGVAFVYYTPTEGFQDKTDPMLILLLSNLLKSYMGLSSKIKDMGIESKEIEGTTLDKFVQYQIDTLQELGKKCFENPCTEEEIKNPSFLSVYNSANAFGEIGLPEISFESIAIESADAQVSSEMEQSEMGPETQLPAAQMPASVISSTKPSLDECKKHYRCNISTNME